MVSYELVVLDLVLVVAAVAYDSVECCCRCLLVANEIAIAIGEEPCSIVWQSSMVFWERDEVRRLLLLLLLPEVGTRSTT